MGNSAGSTAHAVWKGPFSDEVRRLQYWTCCCVAGDEHVWYSLCVCCYAVAQEYECLNRKFNKLIASASSEAAVITNLHVKESYSNCCCPYWRYIVMCVGTVDMARAVSACCSSRRVDGSVLSIGLGLLSFVYGSKREQRDGWRPAEKFVHGWLCTSRWESIASVVLSLFLLLFLPHSVTFRFFSQSHIVCGRRRNQSAGRSSVCLPRTLVLVLWRSKNWVSCCLPALLWQEARTLTMQIVSHMWQNHSVVPPCH